DDLLRLLSWRVGGRLVHELETPAVLRTGAIASALPSPDVEGLIGPVGGGFPTPVAPGAPGRGRQLVRGGLALTPVDLLVHRSAVDEHGQGLADRRVRKNRVSRLEARALAVHLAPRVGEVTLDVLDVAGRIDLGSAFAPLLETLKNVVLDLNPPSQCVLTRLEYGARGGGGVTAALHLDAVEEGAVGHVVARIDLPANDIARPEVHEAVGAGSDR